MHNTPAIPIISIQAHLLAGDVDAYARCHAFEAPHKLKLPLLAKHFAVCETNLLRWYKVRYGRTIHQGIIQTRHERICAMLQGKQYTIKEIAIMAGYSELANFSRDFSRLAGFSPSGYRYLHGEAEGKVVDHWIGV
jgi:AraC family transcriptional regulator of adaptative response / methylphosphotriester-DNA alkyltransferase methyltransferase